MNNVELENKIKELSKIPNYFDMILAVKDFESTYKKSDFYKKTKKPLKEVVIEARAYYMLQFNDLTAKIQKVINELDYNKLQELMDTVESTFTKENADIQELVQDFASLFNK